MKTLIDPPSPYASTEEWKAFLAELRKVKSPSVEIRSAIKDAEKWIEALRLGVR